jgi:hypothetical protein
MVKNIDLLGNEVKTGDILIELGRGCEYDGEKRYYSLKIWQKPSSNDGSGFEYDIDGKKSKYWWASVRSSIKVNMDLMPDGFEYSFKHGMSDISTTIEKGTIHELIENSNWKDNEVKKEQVERYEFMKKLKIETLDDIKSNIQELKKGGYVPHEIVSNVLNIVGVGRTFVHNGEIGIAGMYDHLHYQAIIEALSKDQNYFEKVKLGGKI